MKQFVVSRWKAFLAAVLSFLGFSSCNGEDNPFREVRVMYGTPTATYQVDLTVKDSEGNPLKGIQVTQVESYSGDTLYTNADGKVSAELKAFPDNLSLVLEDVDGQQNGGTFQTDTVPFEAFKLNQLKEGDGWDAGTFSATAERELSRQ